MIFQSLYAWKLIYDSTVLINGLASAKYSILFQSADSKRPNLGMANPDSPSWAGLPNLLVMTLVAGQDKNSINIRWEFGGRVNGRVQNIHGQALSNIDVGAYQWNGEQFEWRQTVNTNNQGYYQFKELAQGDYFMAFIDWSGLYQNEAYDNEAPIDAYAINRKTTIQVIEGQW